MGSLSDFLENELLDHVCNATYTSPANIYLALLTADATDAGTGATISECANANNYARAAISFGLAAARVVDQDAQVTFNQASGSWGTVSHWAILDGNTHGADNMLAHGAFTESKAIVNGNTPSVASGEIDVTFSSGDISTFLANELLDHCFNNATYTSPATHVGLWTSVLADGSDGDTAGEVSGGSYARVQVDVNLGTPPYWDVAASGLVDNTQAISFTTATASWGTVTSVGIFDAATSGNLLFYDNTMADQAVGDGDTASFPIGDLDITLD